MLQKNQISQLSDPFAQSKGILPLTGGRSSVRKLSLAMMYACPRRRSNYSLSSRCVQFRAHRRFGGDAERDM